MSAELIRCADLAGWLLERRKSIGASDAPAVLGVSSFASATPLKVYLDKTSTEDPGAAEETEEQRWGHLLEGPVAERFSERTGLAAEAPPPWSLFRKEGSPLHATPDRFLRPPKGAEPIGILEIKSTRFRGEEWEVGPPLGVQVQVQHQLLVLGFEAAYVAVLIQGSEYRQFQMNADRSFQAALSEKLAEFWERVQARNPPAPSGAADFDTVRRMFSRAQKKTVSLPKGMMLTRDVWLAAKEARFAAEAAEKRAAVEMMAALGDAEIGLLPDGTGIKWANEPREEKAKPARTINVRVLRHLRNTKGLTSGNGADGTEAKPVGDDVGQVRIGPGEVPPGGEVHDLRQPGD